ncbi:cation/H(+) antiporter 15-like [Vigna radiata var. radiata]|uniref:Cation/H(+) antiporter 15-like n=1 Tax=Vigna radiata var. radiata TaxID=3916 RepID=A0A1S3UAK4_VIGRR|nr:cation/H(+) antiporter 15-like [Vigna radiata var. radiata]
MSLNKTLWVCENTTSFQPIPRGIFFNDNPLNYTLTLISLQASIACLSTLFLEFLLVPLGETTFIPHVLAGLLTGTSFLGKASHLKKLFSTRALYIVDAISGFGVMMFLFLMGVKVDPLLVFRTGKKTWAIGLCSSVFPLIFSIGAAYILRQYLSPDLKVYKSLYFIAAFSSTGSFQATASALQDFKLLNSEVGRLAISSSMINGGFSALWQGLFVSHRTKSMQKYTVKHLSFGGLSLIALVLVILCICRPIMLWMIRMTPKGKPVKESYIVSIYVMVLGCSFVGEVIGEHYIFGPLILGLAVPEGPPLGSALVERLDTLISGLLLPLFFLTSSNRFNLDLISFDDFIVVQLVALGNFFAKLAGVMLPSLYCKMPLTDALALALILCAQGFTQLMHCQSLQTFRLIDDRAYTQMVIALIWVTAASCPIVKFLYDPSKSYMSLTRWRTIEHSPPDIELPIIACIHCEENTTSMINFLEISNSRVDSPIYFHVLHLLQLKGRSTPLLIDHEPKRRSSSNLSRSNHSVNIINAFKSYEKYSRSVNVKVYTCISPYETMHDEICMQAAQKRACILIAPFHKQFRTNGVIELASSIRALNRHLLRTAPCSVGILVERGSFVSNNPLTTTSFYNVAVVFIEGPDDREALAYAMRIADHPNVSVTVIRITEPRKKSRTSIIRDPDAEIVHKFMINYLQMKRHDFKEQVVRDSLEMVGVIRTLKGCFDLILVGRRHESESSMFYGMNDWMEYPELGSVADMLVSSDSTFDGSVLVVQQQNKVGRMVGRQDYYNSANFFSRSELPTVLEVQPETTAWHVI